MKYVIDIDNTICEEKGAVIDRKPFSERIKYINNLYDEGHYIVYHTARGLKSGRGESYYRPITEAQLEKWGAKYNELCFKNHDADFYIDDKMLSLKDFFGENL